MAEIKVINKSGFPLPKAQTNGSAGVDLHAVLDGPVELGSLERQMIPTGLFVALPEGLEGQIRPRSGLAWKKGLTVLNSPGTIDSDYRGEIKVVLVNLSNETVVVEPGDRIAQLIIAEYQKISWLPTEELESTERGSGGYGHTGKN